MKNSVSHALKILPEYFSAVKNGTKTFEIRFNDRDYRVNDTLTLQEYDQLNKGFTGNKIRVRVSYILESNMLASGYIAMAIKRIEDDVTDFKSRGKE